MAPSIGLLSTELLRAIFEYIYDSSPTTLPALGLVNKSFSRIAYPYKHRHQNFVFSVDNPHEKANKTQATIKALLNDRANASTLRAIRSITINAYPKSDDWYSRRGPVNVDNTRWTVLVDLLIELPYLESLTFAGEDPIPKIVLETIEKYHKTAHLNILNWSRYDHDEDHNNPDEIALARSPNLRSIQARLLNANTTYDFRLAAFKRIVAMAPNLQHVDIFQGSSGCVDGHDTDPEGLDEEEDCRRQALFDIEATPKAIKSLKMRGFSNINTLELAIDSSKIESLDIDFISDAGFFTRDGPPNSRFPNLKHLSISITSYFDDATEFAVLDFIASSNPLQTLRLSGGRNGIPLSTILSAHGTSLRTLSLHQTESVDEPHKPLSLADISQIGQCCPLLEDLTIDVGNGNSDGLRAVIPALATFPKLSILRIYIPLGISQQEALTTWLMMNDEAESDAESRPKIDVNPLEDDCWLGNMWSIFRTEKRKHGTPALRELHINLGEWDREIGHGYQPYEWIAWEASHRRYLVAKPSERDDRLDELLVEEMERSP